MTPASQRFPRPEFKSEKVERLVRKVATADTVRFEAISRHGAKVHVLRL
jgi:hypothetical protein